MRKDYHFVHSTATKAGKVLTLFQVSCLGHHHYEIRLPVESASAVSKLLGTYDCSLTEAMAHLAEIARDLDYADRNECPSCDGYGDHGFEEETGFRHVCYGCYGSGKYFTGGRQ